jgi:hypothetical protein
MPILHEQLPDSIKEKITDPAQRRRYGKTLAEKIVKRDRKSELELHSQFSAYLHRNSAKIALVIHADPSKRSRITPGTPDYSIFFKSGHALFVEFKVGNNTLTDEQAVIVGELRRAGFPVLVTSSYELATTVAEKLSQCTTN